MKQIVDDIFTVLKIQKKNDVTFFKKQ